MENKCLNKFICIFILLITIVVCFSGCDLLSTSIKGIRESEVPEEDLKIFSAIDYTSYEYSKKVVVLLCNSDNCDSLNLATENGDNWWSSTKEILSGTFEKVGWYDNNLFILMDKKYYSLDINGYEVPPLNEDGETQYPECELKEYSESQFKILYPDYESFDWYGH